ncbi:WD repeat-containing and planar cell polarity effector protein fritz homolog, partial [Tachysurus ichikawai]
VSSLELVGGGGRRTSRRVALSRAQDVGVCWWQGGHDDVSDCPRLVLLGCSERPGLMVAEWQDVHDILMLRFHRGPLAAMRLGLGVLKGTQFGALELLQNRTRCGEGDAALGILGNMDWRMMGEECYHGLVSVTNHLLSKPLDEQTEAQLEYALGTFYNPFRAIKDRVKLVFQDCISPRARRFFYHLLTHERYEKALSLAQKLGARDLLTVRLL